MRSSNSSYRDFICPIDSVQSVGRLFDDGTLFARRKHEEFHQHKKYLFIYLFILTRLGKTVGLQQIYQISNNGDGDDDLLAIFLFTQFFILDFLFSRSPSRHQLRPDRSIKRTSWEFVVERERERERR